MNKIELIKSKNKYDIFLKNEDLNLEKIFIHDNLKNIYGIESYKNKFIINWEINDDYYKNVEEKLLNYTKDKKLFNNYTFVTSIHNDINNTKLLRTFTDNKDCETNKIYRVKIIVDNFWFNNKKMTFGITWTSNI